MVQKFVTNFNQCRCFDLRGHFSWDTWYNWCSTLL